MQEKNYKGKPRGGAGLGQGRTAKPHKSKSFRLSEDVVKILEKFTDESKIVTEIVEVAIMDLNHQFEIKNKSGVSDEDSNFISKKKDSIFKKMEKVVNKNLKNQ